MRYELYYWSSIQGRGEFVRLALEEADADYVDVARQPGGEAEMMRLMESEEVRRPSFAPPFLKAGALLIGQTADILLYLGGQHSLAPVAEAGRLWVHQLQLTIADLVDEAHDTHHPIASSLYYEDQRYAFPRAMAALEPNYPRVVALHDRIAARPRIAAYLGSDRRIPFNRHGIFRHYPELDGET